ncbi:MAG TPA: NADPH-dependent assimilatory sulfite reductase hemoprotein subunit [Aggregatilineales bacterium]|nr:NADPH-dependent assimilatory sulfite reductase hemoprotein subunit [Anaerolineales bacterium]HRE49517.1 NADPH-dependent assimilatory sulfite reductase hemoprotein subunit [Aggregatilineales bacterium]
MSKGNVEQIKLESHGLRGSLEDEFANGEAFLSEAGKQLIKFHGSYQQEDRDARKNARKEKPTESERHGKQVSFMIRSKIPGGGLTAAQYLIHDDLATQYGNGTLRLTTRQAIQLHGVIKGELRETIRALNSALVTTFGACGDVVRNVMACPAPSGDAPRQTVQAFATTLSDALLPKTRAYHQIWIDGEAIIEDEDEPLYGKTYLPRKFKAAVAFPGDNCVDIFTQDVGLVALFDEDGVHLGFNVLAGGGMGMTHNNEETFPRLADVIGFVAPQDALEVVKAIVTIHRDFGDRENRKHARLKYVLHERGVAWFREELQRRVPFTIHAPRPMPDFRVDDHLGWHEQGDGCYFLGIPVASGRVYNDGAYRLRDGLRTVIERFSLPVRLTAQQNILLTDIHPDLRPEITAILTAHGIQLVEALSGVRRHGLACPALPTCGLAIAEAERALPDLLTAIEGVLSEVGIADDPITIRMTGCPNGCARPYVAEVGIVGRSLNKYTIFLGGVAANTRLNTVFRDLVPFEEIAPTLRPVFTAYRDGRQGTESFGEFVVRVGVDALRDTIAEAVPTPAGD